MSERMGTAQALKNATRTARPGRPAARGEGGRETTIAPQGGGSVTPFAPPVPARPAAHPPMPPAPATAPANTPTPAQPAAAPPAPAPAPPPVQVPVQPPVQTPVQAAPPVARPARRQRRHRGVLASFLLLVLLPLALVAGYMWGFARDQYASSTGFTLRQEEDPTATALTGGLAAMLGGGGSASNARVLYDYIDSQAMVARLEQRVGLRALYAPGWPQDPLFAVAPTATIEDLTDFWRRMTRLEFDEASGLMAITVRTHDPASAQALATVVVEEAQAMINRLNRAARDDAMRHADADLAAALARMRAARAALAEFRASTQIVDPAADLQARMGILTGLQEQLAAAYIDLDLLNSVSSVAEDPRRRQLERRITVIRDRIATERRNFTDRDVTTADTDYPTLFARYEGLLVDQEVADLTFRTAQTAHDLARARAERQTLYLAPHIEPTLAQQSRYPARAGLTALAGLFLLLGWSVLVLVWYSLRDRG